MQIVSASVTKGSENPARPSGPNVPAHERTGDVLQRGEDRERALTAHDRTGFTPSRYMLLISRVDRMVQEGRVERPALDRLADFLAEKIARLSEQARRQIRELPQLQALGVEALDGLPGAVHAQLQQRDRADAVLHLLKEPAFAAHMKDRPHARIYGPQGELLAS